MKIHLIHYYRVLPELRGVSDADCRKLVRIAKAKRADAIWMLPRAAILAMAAWLTVSAGLWEVLRIAMPKLPGLNMTLAIALGIIPAGITYTLIYRRLINRSIVHLLAEPRCPYCQYALTGLEPRMGKVTCPECGEQLKLVEHGFTPQDLAVIPSPSKKKKQR